MIFDPYMNFSPWSSAILPSASGVLGLTISEFRGHSDDSGHLTVRVWPTSLRQQQPICSPTSKSRTENQASACENRDRVTRWPLGSHWAFIPSKCTEKESCLSQAWRDLPCFSCNGIMFDTGRNKLFILHFTLQHYYAFAKFMKIWKTKKRKWSSTDIVIQNKITSLSPSFTDIVCLGIQTNLNPCYTVCPPATINTANQSQCLLSWSVPKDKGSSKDLDMFNEQDCGERAMDVVLGYK